jgi:hypothetical protein
MIGCKKEWQQEWVLISVQKNPENHMMLYIWNSSLVNRYLFKEMMHPLREIWKIGHACQAGDIQGAPEHYNPPKSALNHPRPRGGGSGIEAVRNPPVLPRCMKRILHLHIIHAGALALPEGFAHSIERHWRLVWFHCFL